MLAQQRGRAFDPGRGYGWARDITANNRKRGKNSDPVLDSLLFTRSEDTWACTVPNGRYYVTVCVGDSGFSQQEQRVVVEGEALIDSVDTLGSAFETRSTMVDVRDGRLTVDIGGGGSKGNTTLVWLRWVQVKP